MPGGRVVVNLNPRKVIEAVRAAKVRLLNAQVDAAARIAQANVVHDTRFASEHTYAIHVGGSGLPAVTEIRTHRSGRRSVRIANAVPAPPAGSAAFGCAASYALALEHRNRTFSDAARAVDSVAKDIIQDWLSE